MVKLIHNSVDGYTSSWGEWPDEPTRANLTDLLTAYYDDDEAGELACMLIANREVCVGDASNTQFTLV